MDPVLRFGSAEVRVKPEQMQLTNALLILLMIPVFDRVVYPSLRKCGVVLRPLKRMAIGMALTGLSFVFAGILQSVIDAGEILRDGKEPHCVSGCVPILWQVPQYFVITAGEVMFSITGIEFGSFLFTT